VLLAGWLAGCGATAGPTATPLTPVGSASVAAAGPDEEKPGPVPTVRVGRPGRTERVHFVPETLVLPGNARAPVQPARTVDGQLQVPENVQHVGWWDGSAYAGDPFGRTVIARHVDSTNGAGFFARLLRVKVGDVVTLRAGSHRLSYRISAVQTVARRALATDSQAFDQSGAHRLVLITCTGEYRRDRGGYESNLVVVGVPLGLAR
jgi:LPXTG-site transpeptidase (sortase) family protein